MFSRHSDNRSQCCIDDDTVVTCFYMNNKTMIFTLIQTGSSSLLIYLYDSLTHVLPTECLWKVVVELQACQNTLQANPQLRTRGKEKLHDLPQCIMETMVLRLLRIASQTQSEITKCENMTWC